MLTNQGYRIDEENKERERALCVSKTGIASCLLMYGGGGGPFLVSYQWATGEFWGILPPYTLSKAFRVYD